MSITEKPKAIVRQTPHCEGQEVNRRLFNKYEPDADRSFILAKRDSDSELSRIILEAGTAQGITIGSRMAVHAYNFLGTDETSNPCLGSLTVNKVDRFSSVLEVPSDPAKLQPPFYCFIKSIASEKKIALYCENRAWLESVFPPEERNQSMTIVDDVTDCHLKLTVMDEKVHFARYHDLVNQHIGDRIIHTVDLNNKPAIRNVVKGSYNFYYHLTRPGIRLKQVSMELTKLVEKQDPSDDFGTIISTGENLIVNDPATIVVDQASLGMKIINGSNRALYPYLFYFDPTDLTIGIFMFTFH